MTTANYMQVVPKEYKQTGACPTCGAPIFADAACFVDEKLVMLPHPYFTCQCRLTLQPQVVPVPYPVPLQPTSPYGDPQKITWTVTSTPIPPNTTIIPCGPTPTAQPNTLDWKRFTESGGVTQHPDLSKNIVCVNAHLSMASGAMPSLQNNVLLP